MTQPGRPSPIVAGLRCRCPVCGEGDLLEGFLGVRSECDSCGADLSKADSGDGPAVFVMFLVGFIVVPLALALEVGARPPLWLHLLLWLPLSLALTLAFLRPFKGVLVALQFHHGAEEARLEDDEPGASP